MTSIRTDITSKPRQHRLRAALGAALILTLAPLLVLLSATGSEAATARKNAARIVEPTSVAVAATSCTNVAAGVWDVTVTFAVTGGRYLNLGAPSEASQTIRERDYDNVRGGGVRYVEATQRYYYHPGFTEDGTVVAATDTFLYQHSVAPITSARKYVSVRTVRVLSRDIEATFTCA
jgi:hypothetical protein